jgi:hypothetical protein
VRRLPCCGRARGQGSVCHLRRSHCRPWVRIDPSMPRHHHSPRERRPARRRTAGRHFRPAPLLHPEEEDRPLCVSLSVFMTCGVG